MDFDGRLIALLGWIEWKIAPNLQNNKSMWNVASNWNWNIHPIQNAENKTKKNCTEYANNNASDMKAHHRIYLVRIACATLNCVCSFLCVFISAHLIFFIRELYEKLRSWIVLLLFRFVLFSVFGLSCFEFLAPPEPQTFAILHCFERLL